MPLYKKALKFTSKDLDNMSFDECYELLLCFRYLHFRNDSSISRDLIETHMEAIKNRMHDLNQGAAHSQNFT